MRKRTDKSKYKHQSTGEHCTCAAYIAEMMCMKNAEFKNQGSLPYKFWNIDPWTTTFLNQIIEANKLLKKYSEAGILKAIRSSEFEFQRIFSLKHGGAIPIIEKYDKIVKDNLDKNQDLDIKENPETRSATFGKRSKLSQLRNMKFDGKKKE